MENKILDNLIGSGDIKDYLLEEVIDKDGVKDNDTTKLTLVMLSGKKLVIESVYSGYFENTDLFIDEE
jgi:hypothetical protein